MEIKASVRCLSAKDVYKTFMSLFCDFYAAGIYLQKLVIVIRLNLYICISTIA